MKSGTTVALVIFVVLWMVCSVFSFLSYQNIKAAKISMNRKLEELKKKKEEYAESQKRLTQISNLLGFRDPSYTGGSSSSDADSIIVLLDTVCYDETSPIHKNALKLPLGSDTIQIDKAGKILEGNWGPGRDESYKNKLQNIHEVKRLINLEDVWEAVVRRLEDLQKQVDREESLLKKEREQYETLVQQTQNEIVELQKGIQQKRVEIEENDTKNTEAILEAEKARQSAHSDALVEKDTLAKLEKQLREQTKKFSTEQQNLDERIREIQAEATGQSGVDKWLTEKKETSKTQDSPDGEILFSSEKQDIAYIDLGRADGVLKGMAFDVITYGKTGRKELKGKIEIREVQEHMSKVGIISVENSLNPIRQGDRIINSVYDRNKVRYFVIAGKLSQKYSTEQVRRLVIQIGGQIEDTLTPKTDIIILGDGFANDPIYQYAKERGVETMLEAEFLGYLGEF